MMTSTVAPLLALAPLRASRSFDTLCLPSAKDNPAASRVISVKRANRLPQVVVPRMASLDNCFVPGVLDERMSWTPEQSCGPTLVTWPVALIPVMGFSIRVGYQCVDSTGVGQV